MSSIELVKVLVDKVRLRVPKHITKFLSQIRESHFVDCDQQRSARFWKEFGPATDDDDAKMFMLAARDMLSSAKVVLDELGIRFWISSGTCLGELQYSTCEHLVLVIWQRCVARGPGIESFVAAEREFSQNCSRTPEKCPTLHVARMSP